MSAEDFHFLEDEKTDDSIIERGFIKIYHQSGANVDNENSKIKFFFGKNHIFIQVGDGYLEFDINIEKADNHKFIVDNDNTNEVIRLTNIAFAYTIHDGVYQHHLELNLSRTNSWVLSQLWCDWLHRKMVIYLHILI